MTNQEPVAEAIHQFLAHLPAEKESRFIVALSGGADSISLLHALSQRIERQHITAVYIDHQLQPQSSGWGKFNREICQKWGIPFEVVEVSVNTDSASLESEARRARYKALKNFVVDDRTYLLTAHHKNDQVETLLLQLFRGAGPKGLSAMPVQARFGQGFHYRPMLAVSRSDVLNYCSAHQLNYIEDPSNKDTTHRRNFLRLEVLPLLKQEWPQLEDTLCRVSEIQADTQEMVEEVAQQDFENCHTELKGINLKQLNLLSETRQNHLLRFWFSQLGLDMPSQKVLGQLKRQMLQSADDSQPELPYQRGVFRRHAGFLVWGREEQLDADFSPLPWDGKDDLLINNGVVLTSSWLRERHPELVGKSLRVSMRKGGERFRKLNAKHTTSLKNYLQESGVPSWQRSQLILISHADEVRAIYSGHLKDSI
ncbi:tRNA lysidine(34) synthetase TilS [Kangiella sediminilitoris]|uniref:tRNA(Ile)-lysidine synthase n=1 Tax=Kangiella sediminilitoris TaxID=1144748 RepID=A0A1B3BC32_9GAMM|nr:tRNA lysidine(34) synthetase TilS [Kangiella sediminilitoris]AOE50340.1 tRNA(Ile)-lysidine synthase [Kangiella sediminilitoris]